MARYKPAEVGYTDLSAMWDDEGPELKASPTPSAEQAQKKEDEAAAHRAEVREFVAKQGENALAEAGVELDQSA